MKKPIALLATIVAFTLSLSACGGTSTASQSQPSPSSGDTDIAESPAEEVTTLPDGLSGSCTGDTLTPMNKLQSVNLKTENGQLDISIPGASDMTLVDTGYYVNIFTDDFKQTQIKMEYSTSTGEKTVSVSKMFGDGMTQKIGTFDVDHSNGNLIQVSVPTSEIAGDKDITWNSAIDMNGKDTGFCPAKQNDKAKLE